MGFAKKFKFACIQLISQRLYSDFLDQQRLKHFSRTTICLEQLIVCTEISKPKSPLSTIKLNVLCLRLHLNFNQSVVSWRIFWYCHWGMFQSMLIIISVHENKNSSCHKCDPFFCVLNVILLFLFNYLYNTHILDLCRAVNKNCTKLLKVLPVELL